MGLGDRGSDGGGAESVGFLPGHFSHHAQVFE